VSKKQNILEAATKLFSEKGFRETRISELSKMTGAAEGTIFYHFRNKEEIFVNILKTFRDDIIKAFEAHVADSRFANGLEMMEGAISFYLHSASAMEDRFLLLHRHDAYELAKVNPVCREQLETIYNCFLDIFERAIVVGQADGSIGSMPARKTALIIFSMVDGLVRFNTYGLYHAGALYNELIEACRRMLKDS